MAVKAPMSNPVPPSSCSSTQPHDPDEEVHWYTVLVPLTSQFCMCCFICLKCLSLPPTDVIEGIFLGNKLRFAILRETHRQEGSSDFGAEGPASCAVGFIKAGDPYVKYIASLDDHITQQNPATALGCSKEADHWVHD